MIFLIIPYMAITARMSGGGLWAHKIPSYIPEILFSFGFGISAFQYGGWLGFISASAWSYVAMQSGHGTFYGMNGYDDHNRPNPDKPRVQTLEKIFRPLFIKMGGDIMTPYYSWYMMAIKGTLIAAPLGAFSLILTILWPLSYYIGVKIKNHAVSELLSGACAGLSIVVFLLCA